MSALWSMPMTRLAALLRAGDVSAVEVAESVLGRIDETEPRVRAWAHVDPKLVRDSAARADRLALSGGHLGPLHGIPIGVKDVIDVRGMPTAAGSDAVDFHIACTDAGAVASLRDSGAIIAGKTVTHEFAFGQGTPPTINPRDPLRYAGGSSVGSGVAVAVGSAHGALGTDTGGSVRNPAAVNGLVGMKPSAGLIVGSGVLHISDSLDQIGPIARSTGDCALLLEGMVMPERRAQFRAGAIPPRGAERRRVAVDRRTWAAWGVAPVVRDVIDEALRAMQRQGVEIIEVELPELDLALPASLALSLSESVAHHRGRLAGASERYLPETRVMIETGALVTAADRELACRVRDFVRTRIVELFQQLGIVALASPTLPSIAPLAATMSHHLTGETGSESLSSALQMLTTANLTGLPALSVACGFTGGLPVGLHLLGLEFTDGLLLDIAKDYEESTDWSSHVPVGSLP